MNNKNDKKSFWATLPPLLQGIAAVIAAIVALLALFPYITPPVIPDIDYFTAEDSLLNWSVSDATTVTIDQGIGGVASKGTCPVFPAKTTTYTLTATREGESTDASVQVVVIEPVIPVINYFTANPNEITLGEDSTLSWSVSDATTVTIDPDIGSVISDDTGVVSPDENTTYTLTATNEAGSVTVQAMIIVSLPDLIVESLTHSPITPTTADQITFTAVVKNAGIFSAGPSTLLIKVGGETYGREFSIPSLGPGETHTVQRQEILVVANQYYRNIVTVDVNNDVPESNEDNNVQTYDYAVIEPSLEYTLTLISLVGEDGHVREGWGGVNIWPDVGDDYANIGMQAFLSFDISGIPAGSTILDVVVDFSDHDIVEDPFGSLGCLGAYLQDYGTLDAGDYYTSYPLGAILRFCSSGELNTPRSDPNVTSALQGKVGSSRFQMRLQFKDKTSDGDAIGDMVRFGNSRLTVTYIPPALAHVGSINSDVYHTITCSYVNSILEQNRIYFSSTQEAEQAGYRACLVCKPP